MVRIINVCSGKGGVGKTTIALNLAAALQKFGMRMAVIDCNLTTSHVGLQTGLYSQSKTLNDFLRNAARLEDVTYTHPSGIKIVPASLDINDLNAIDTENFKEKIREAFRDYDFVLLDSAPGLGKESLIAVKACDELLFVANPFIPSVVDIAKYNQLVEHMEDYPKTIGVIVNRSRKKKYELTNNEIMQFTEMPVIGTVPEDEHVLKTVNRRLLVVDAKKNAKSSKAMIEIAAKLIGIEFRRGWFFGRRGYNRLPQYPMQPTNDYYRYR
jgi:septum site-determining protein MinD